MNKKITKTDLKEIDQEIKKIEQEKHIKQTQQQNTTEEDKLLKMLSGYKQQKQTEYKQESIPRKEAAQKLFILHKLIKRDALIIALAPLVMFFFGLFYDDTVTMVGFILSFVFCFYGLFIYIRSRRTMNFLAFEYNLQIKPHLFNNKGM